MDYPRTEKQTFSASRSITGRPCTARLRKMLMRSLATCTERLSVQGSGHLDLATCAGAQRTRSRRRWRRWRWRRCPRDPHLTKPILLHVHTLASPTNEWHAPRVLPITPIGTAPVLRHSLHVLVCTPADFHMQQPPSPSMRVDESGAPKLRAPFHATGSSHLGSQGSSHLQSSEMPKSYAPEPKRCTDDFSFDS